MTKCSSQDTLRDIIRFCEGKQNFKRLDHRAPELFSDLFTVALLVDELELAKLVAAEVRRRRDGVAAAATFGGRATA